MSPNVRTSGVKRCPILETSGHQLTNADRHTHTHKHPHACRHTHAHVIWVEWQRTIAAQCDHWPITHIMNSDRAIDPHSPSSPIPVRSTRVSCTNQISKQLSATCYHLYTNTCFKKKKTNPTKPERNRQMSRRSRIITTIGQSTRECETDKMCHSAAVGTNHTMISNAHQYESKESGLPNK